MAAHMAPPSMPSGLPDGARRLLDGIRTYEILGGSNVTRAMLDACAIVADRAPGASPEAVIRQLEAVRDFVCGLKPNTAAFVNAGAWVLRPLRALAPAAHDDLRDLVRARVAEFRRRSDDALRRIGELGAGLLRDGGAVLVHDYSSTVMTILRTAGREGRRPRVLVTEARPLNDGLRVLRGAFEMGFPVEYLVDVAAPRKLPLVDLVLTGAEVVLLNGDLGNSIGTAPIAMIAASLEVPVYAATETFKIHPTCADTSCLVEMRALRAWFRPEDHGLPAGIPTDMAVQDVTPARYLAGYITEQGLLRPSQMADCSRRFYAELDAPAGHEA